MEALEHHPRKRVHDLAFSKWMDDVDEVMESKGWSIEDRKVVHICLGDTRTKAVEEAVAFVAR